MSTIYGMTVTFGGSSSSSGGTVPQVTVTAPTGSTVTATKGDVTLTTAEKNGVWVFDLPEFGSWVITATNGVQTVTENVVFEGSKAVTFSYFSATIAVTYPAGSTCTCSNGATTLTAPDTSGSCTFIVTGAGIWTVSSTDGDNYATQDVEIVNDGQAATVTLAYAATAHTSASDGVAYTSGISDLDPATLSLFAEAISNNSAITSGTSMVYVDYATANRKISVGDTVTINCGGESHIFRVIGFNHDTLNSATAYGEVTATGKAGITLEMSDCLSATAAMHSSNSNSVGWSGCLMRNNTVPTYLSTLDSVWKSVIKTVSKLNGTRGATADTLFLLSEIEATGATKNSFTGEGSMYAYYAAGNSRKKLYNGADDYWWLRSPKINSSTNFCLCHSSLVASVAATGPRAVSYAFCI